MKITSLKLENVFSFGKEQELKNFSTFNLFIGKNGSGKSNVFNILCVLTSQYEDIKNKSIKNITSVIKKQCFDDKSISINIDSEIPPISTNGIINNNTINNPNVEGTAGMALKAYIELNYNNKGEKCIRYETFKDFPIFQLTKGNINDINALNNITKIELPSIM